MTLHRFQESLTRGRKSETQVREWLEGLGAEVRPVSMTGQRAGIDFLVKMAGASLTLEVKRDERTSTTGMVVMEDISNVERATLGWVHTSQAHSLAYHCPGLKSPRHPSTSSTLFWMPLGTVRAYFPIWKTLAESGRGGMRVATLQNTIRTQPGPQGRYTTQIILVPWRELSHHCDLIAYL